VPNSENEIGLKNSKSGVARNSEITIGNNFIGIDLLADLRSSAYFEMKEALLHYFSLSASQYRKDFNIEAAAAIDAFNCLSNKDRSALHQAFTIGYRRPELFIERAKANDHRQPLLQSTQNAERYFLADDLKDLKSLKNAYKKKAKIHHPDSGGDHQSMLALNSTFNELLEKISTGHYKQFAQKTEQKGIWKDYVEVDMTPMPRSVWCNWIGPLVQGRFSHGLRVYQPVDIDKAIALLRASFAIDEYDLPEALSLFTPILRKLSNRKRDFGMNAAVIEASIELCRRLRAAHLDTEAEQVSQQVRTSCLNLHLHWWHNAKLLGEVMDANVRPKVNPLHPRQRRNLERYVQHGKTGTASRLLKARQTKEIQFRDAISAMGGFINLPFDPPNPQYPSLADKKIPQPNSWTPLSAEQIGEYHFAFYKSPTLGLVVKHLALRCEMWFAALFEVAVPIERLLTEIRSVADYAPQTLNRTPARQRIDSFIPRGTFMDFVDVLLGLPINEVRHRLNLLTAIHDRYSETMIHWVTTHVIQNSHTVGSVIGLRNICFPDIRDTYYREKSAMLSYGGQLTLNPVLVRSWRKEWFKAACAPIEQLERALETGWMMPREESVKEAWQRWAEYSASNKLTEDAELK
jgi:hypothetical protein